MEGRAMALNDDGLWPPAEHERAVATVALIAVGGGAGVAAAMGSFVPAFLLAPFFLGAFVGLFAIRRPVRAVLALVVLGNVLLAVTTAGTSSSGLALVSAALVGYVAPLMVLGSLCTSTLRRWHRADAVPALEVAA
jgi:hypothetical protein